MNRVSMPKKDSVLDGIGFDQVEQLRNVNTEGNRDSINSWNYIEPG